MLNFRSNLRRMMSEQKSFEKSRIKSELEMCEQEKEARLETLRRLGRRRLGLDLIKHEEDSTSTACQTTKAWNERTRVLESERIARSLQLIWWTSYISRNVLAVHRILNYFGMRNVNARLTFCFSGLDSGALVC